MFNELTKIINEKIADSKKIVFVVLSTIVLLILVWVGLSNLNKGTLEVNFSAPEGPVEILMSNPDGKKELPEGKYRPEDAVSPTIYSSSKRAFKVKLEPGKYDVNAVVTFKNNDQEVKIRANQTVELTKRSTQKINLIAKAPPQAQKIDEADRISNLKFNLNKLYSTSDYGVTDVYSADDNYSKKTIRNEPAFLKTVRSICHYSNGNAVAVDYSGRFYKVVGTSATPLDVSSIPADQFARTFSIINSFAFDDSALTCAKDNFYLSSFAKIDKDFNITQNPELTNTEDYKNFNNYSTNYAGGLFLLNYPGSESLAGSDSNPDASSSKDNSKNILYLSGDLGSDAVKLSLDSTPGSFSSFSSDKFCYSDSREIKCQRAIKDSSVDFKIDTSEYVQNIQMISEDKLVYLTDKAVWVLELNSSQKRNIFSFGDNKATGVLAFSKDLKTLAFSVNPSALPQSQVGGPTSNYDGPSQNSLYIIKTDDL